MYDLKDKVCLVTGGGAGIGAGLCTAILEEGAKYVAILDVDVNNGKPLESELNKRFGSNKAKFFKCDVTSKDLDDAYDSVLKEFGYIDVVVNAAGIMNDSPAIYKKEIEVNVTALITSSLKAYNLMRKDRGGKGGTIINISSIAGIFQSYVLPIYCGTKSAVLQFSTCLGMKPYYSRSGVRVITICYGATNTSLLSSTKYACIDKESDEDKLLENILKDLPIQSIESAVKGTVDAYKLGESGSSWLISADKPAKDISANVVKGYQIMSEGIYDK